jgi:general stress protein 26
MDRTQLYEMIDGFRTAMFATLTPEGVISSRPMFVAKREHDVLWFVADFYSEAASGVRTFEHATASFQSPLLYLSVAGEASVVDDPALVERWWKDAWVAWFPDGPADPNLTLIRLDIRSADVWDLRGKAGLATAARVVTSIVARQLEGSTEAGPRHLSL